MPTTQLSVELVVIGIGAVLWLGLFVAAIFGYRFDAGLPKFDIAVSFLLLVVAYVLGIVVDRVARALLTPVEHLHFRATLRSAEPAGAEKIERYILETSNLLGKQIQYNRSRLRVCRAWVLNAFLILLAFLVWNHRTGAVGFGMSLLLVGMGLLICVLLAWTTWALSRDHCNNLRDSYKFLKESEPGNSSGDAAQ